MKGLFPVAAALVFVDALQMPCISLSRQAARAGVTRDGILACLIKALRL